MSKVKVVGALGALAISGALVSACGSGSYAYDYTGICVNKMTHKRVDDWHCQQHLGLVYVWMYIHSGDYYPAVGYPYRTRGVRYTFHPNHKMVVSRGGVPRSSGKIRRSGYSKGYTGTTGKTRVGTGTGRSSGYKPGSGSYRYRGGSKGISGGSRGIGGGSRGISGGRR